MVGQTPSQIEALIIHEVDIGGQGKEAKQEGILEILSQGRDLQKICCALTESRHLRTFRWTRTAIHIHPAKPTW